MADAKVKKDLIPMEKQKKILATLEHCKGIQELAIESDEQNEACNEQVKELLKAKKDLEADRKELTQPLYDQQRAINDEYKPVTTALDNAAKVLKRGMTKYWQQQEAERKRKQQEAEARAAEARRKAEEKARKEREKAEQYREQGRTEMADKAAARADEAEDIAETTVATVVQNTKPEGTTFREKWIAKEIDKKAAAIACASNPMLIGALEINLKALERVRAAMKTELPIPGIEWVREDVAVTRTK